MNRIEKSFCLELVSFDDEIWRDILGYEGLYQISNIGRLKSCAKSKNSYSELIYDAYINNAGYRAVQLSKNGSYKWALMHRLVAAAFLPNDENKPFINHLNSIRFDNHVDNLEWCTQKENIRHSINAGRKNSLIGEDNLKCKLKEADVILIFKCPLPNKEIAKKYNVDPVTIQSIKNGTTWSHLTGKQYKRKKLDTNTVLNIFYSKKSTKELCYLFNTKRTTVEAIKTGQNFSRITGKEYTPTKSCNQRI